MEDAAFEQESGVAHAGDVGVDRCVPFAVSLRGERPDVERVAVSDHVHPGTGAVQQSRHVAVGPDRQVRSGLQAGRDQGGREAVGVLAFILLMAEFGFAPPGGPAL